MKAYNWHCKVCDAVNERALGKCHVCDAPKILTPLHAEILTRSHRGLPPDESLLKEQAQRDRLEKMNPLAELCIGMGVMGMLLGFALFRFAWTFALHFWAIGLFIVSWLIMQLGSALDGALSSGGFVKDSRAEAPKENP